MRRLLLACAIAGLALAAAAAPAVGQTKGTFVTIDTFSPRCAAQNQTVNVNVGGQTDGSGVNVAVLAPNGATLDTDFVTSSSGRWSSTAMSFTATQVGTYEVRASGGSVVSAFMDVPCQAPTLEYDPPCFVVGSTDTVTMTARHFVPFGRGYMTYDVGGSEQQQRIRIVNDAHGTFVATFKVTPAARDHPGEGTDGQRSLVAVATWQECVAATTTTEGTTTTVPSITDTTKPPGKTTTTTRTTTRTTTTVPPVVTIPPPTPGVTLTVTPALGPPGFVALARGTGFPPGPVALAWAPGLGTFTTTAAPDGTFAEQVLVFPRDRLGTRGLVATSGTATATAPFLVVASSVQPAGTDVAQINRSSRRFWAR